jgi:hypothetical protein
MKTHSTSSFLFKFFLQVWLNTLLLPAPIIIVSSTQYKKLASA